MIHAKILDCTIRDGGLVNNWDFSVDFVRDLYNGLSNSGVEYMEIGYKNSPKLLQGGNAGPWRFLDEKFLKEVLPMKARTKLSALVDIGRVDENDILPREESMLDLIRVACYIKDVNKGLELVEKFHAMGYETSLNIMALSHVLEHDLEEALADIARSSVDLVYVVDSYGSMDPVDISHLVNKFRQLVPNKQLGIHAHNNMQLAFANTLSGLQHGVSFLDASVYGMGRAAGNCNTELLISHLKNTNYEVRPLLEVIQKHMLKIREKWEWGYIVPYMISGVFDEHPRVAMAIRASERKDHYLDFYDTLTNPESIVAPRTDG
ncbi:MAG: aldolase catalytic domain-containing protein [Gorillibacterium sp.]|nr:aldolase catalytic domain-containing protein [Gorillibacterium sp.]